MIGKMEGGRDEGGKGGMKGRRERSCNMIDRCKRLVARLQDSDCCTVMRCSASALWCDSALPVHARGGVHSTVSVEGQYSVLQCEVKNKPRNGQV